MKERAALLGGQLWLNSSPGRGALVEVTIPYEPMAEPESGGNGEAASG
jgi:signal transduction histidine kinase